MVPLKTGQRLVADLDVQTCKARLVNSVCRKVPPALPRRQGPGLLQIRGITALGEPAEVGANRSGPLVVCAHRASELCPVNTKRQLRPITSLWLSVNRSLLVTQVFGREKLLNVEIGFF
jgi:hypothetical protein